MKNLAKNWITLFTVCLIFGLVGCADKGKSMTELCHELAVQTARMGYYEGKNGLTEEEMLAKVKAIWETPAN